MAFLLQKLKEMLNKFLIKLIINIYLNKFIIRIKSKKIHIENYNYDFQNINFENIEEARKILFSKKFYSKKLSDFKNNSYHCFNWLIAAKKIGGAESISVSKKQIFNWQQKKYSKNSYIWDYEALVKRTTNLLYNYDFYAVSSNANEKKYFHNLIYEHYLILETIFKFKKTKDIRIDYIKIIILLRLIYSKEINDILKTLEINIKDVVDNNGYHKSYNPSKQAEFINQLHEIKNIFLFFNVDSTSKIDDQLFSMSSAFNNLFHKDSSIALFNGSNNLNISKYKKINQIIKDIKPKKMHKIINGLCIYSDKNKKIFYDAVKPSNQQINQKLHSGTFSFEMSSNKEKIITNCGSIEKRFGEKPEYFRYSAAHSTLVINNTNISELSKKSYKRIPKKIYFDCHEDDEKIIWTSSHDGYHLNFGRIVKRKIIISKKKDKVFGEDIILPSKFNSKKLIYNIRFHLTPICSGLLTNSKKSILIKTVKGQSWVFSSVNPITLEDSICINNGKEIEQTKQIVITNYTDSSKRKENWIIEKVN